jgi:hypothetical protein
MMAGSRAPSFALRRQFGVDLETGVSDRVKPQSFEINPLGDFLSPSATLSLMRTVRLCAIIALGMALAYAFEGASAGNSDPAAAASAVAQVLN